MSVPPTSPKLVVTSGLSFWRTPELNEASAVSKQLAEAKEVAMDDMVVSGSFFQETKKVKLAGLLQRVAKIAVPALAATGILVAGVTALPAVLLAGGLGLVSGIMALAEGPALQKGVADYTLARKFQQFEGLDVWRDGGPPAELQVEKTSAPEEGLRELLATNMKDFPQSFQVVHANGHGLGAKYSAGLPGETFAKALNDAVDRSGNEVDVALVDTCFGANFEQVCRYGPGVKYVVAFQDAIPNSNSDAGKIPLARMLTETTNETSARDIATKMAKIAGSHFDSPEKLEIANVPVAERLRPQHLEKLRKGTDSTVVAIDVEAVKAKLHPALDKAGQEFQKLLSDPDFAASVQSSKQASEIEFSHDLIDLGGFLTRIADQAPEGSPVKAASMEALKALEASLMYKRTGEKYPLSGLSVHTRENPGGSGEISGKPTRPLDGDHLPKGWVEFMKKAF